MRSLSLEDAYRVQLRYFENSEDVRGWKIGGSNTKTKNHFRAASPYFGFLTGSQIFSSTDGSSAVAGSFEVEVCIRIPEDFEPHRFYSESEINSWPHYFGAEFPVSGYSKSYEMDLSSLIVDNCAAGSLVVGEVEVEPKLIGKFEIIACQPLEICREELIGSPASIASDFISSASRIGFELAGGQVIATGGLTSLVHLAPGETVSIFSEGRQVFHYVG